VEKTMPQRTIVVVVSIGSKRYWQAIALKWLNVLCGRFGYDLTVCRQPTVSSIRAEQFDRNQNFGRAHKLGIGYLFNYYDRVLQFDDTVMVSPIIPDLIAMVPEEMIGCDVVGKRKNVSRYLEQHRLIYGRVQPLPPERFYNNGVVVYSRHHSALFELATLPWDKISLDTVFATQGYVSHRAEELGFPLFDLGPRFNVTGSQIKKMGNIDNSSAYIFHLTSALSSQERLSYAKEIDRHFRKLARRGTEQYHDT
jgi:hypothetical protein